ncbi:MAG: histidine phosphatase family protein [Clostridia bacterium]|nr:histidine phosphatase family protein [Clostridia bacterium]
MSEILKKEIFYIRHAEPDTNNWADRSHCDIDLTEKGESQAKLAAERFRGREINYLFSSPLVRCIKTAVAFANVLGTHPEIIVIPELIENGSLPDYKGVDMEHLAGYYDNLTLCEEKLYDFPNGENESDEVNVERAEIITAWMKEKLQYGEKALVFCHGSFGNYFIPAAVGMKQGDYILSLSHTSVTKIKYTSDGKQRISFMNDISHLRPLLPDYEFDT